MPFLSRYQQEQEKRHADREALVKAIKTGMPRRTFALREIGAETEKEKEEDFEDGEDEKGATDHSEEFEKKKGQKEEREWIECPKCKGEGCKWCNKGQVKVPVEKKKEPEKKEAHVLGVSPHTSGDGPKEASAQEKQLANVAIHRGRAKLVEAGLHNISLNNPEVIISEGDKGVRTHFIRSAAIRLNATIPVADGKRIAKKTFAVNMSFSEGKYSVDSLEKNDQVFPVNKGGLQKVLAMEDKVTYSGDMNIRTAQPQPHNPFSNPYKEKSDAENDKFTVDILYPQSPQLTKYVVYKGDRKVFVGQAGSKNHAIEKAKDKLTRDREYEK